jgi:hypothetical protein
LQAKNLLSKMPPLPEETRREEPDFLATGRMSQVEVAAYALRPGQAKSIGAHAVGGMLV